MIVSGLCSLQKADLVYAYVLKTVLYISVSILLMLDMLFIIKLFNEKSVFESIMLIPVTADTRETLVDFTHSNKDLS